MPRSDAAPPPALTDGQRRVLAVIRTGKTAGEAAEILGMARGTANLHVFLARRRLGCKTTDELVVEAVRRGLI